MKDEMQGAEDEARCTQGTKATSGRWERTHVRDRARIPKATPLFVFVQQYLLTCSFFEGGMNAFAWYGD